MSQKAVSGGEPVSSVRLAGDNTKDRMYEPKPNQKAMRVLTVIAYVFSVSLAAITLSLYYVFLWKPAASSRVATYNTSASASTSNNCGPDFTTIHSCMLVARFYFYTSIMVNILPCTLSCMH